MGRGGDDISPRRVSRVLSGIHSELVGNNSVRRNRFGGLRNVEKFLLPKAQKRDHRPWRFGLFGVWDDEQRVRAIGFVSAGVGAYEASGFG